jgi:hypothetical protein
MWSVTSQRVTLCVPGCRVYGKNKTKLWAVLITKHPKPSWSPECQGHRKPLRAGQDQGGVDTAQLHSFLTQGPWCSLLLLVVLLHTFVWQETKGVSQGNLVWWTTHGWRLDGVRRSKTRQYSHTGLDLSSLQLHTDPPFVSPTPCVNSRTKHNSNGGFCWEGIGKMMCLLLVGCWNKECIS